MPPRNRRPAV